VKYNVSTAHSCLAGLLVCWITTIEFQTFEASLRQDQQLHSLFNELK